jgi:hypothetical protein
MKPSTRRFADSWPLAIFMRTDDLNAYFGAFAHRQKGVADCWKPRVT